MSVIGRIDGKRYQTEPCPKCKAPMNIVTKNYWFDEFKIKHYTDTEILLFNVCEKCRIQTPITERQHSSRSTP